MRKIELQVTTKVKGLHPISTFVQDNLAYM